MDPLQSFQNLLLFYKYKSLNDLLRRQSFVYKYRNLENVLKKQKQEFRRRQYLINNNKTLDDELDRYYYDEDGHTVKKRGQPYMTRVEAETFDIKETVPLSRFNTAESIEQMYEKRQGDVYVMVPANFVVVYDGGQFKLHRRYKGQIVEVDTMARAVDNKNKTVRVYFLSADGLTEDDTYTKLPDQHFFNKYVKDHGLEPFGSKYDNELIRIETHRLNMLGQKAENKNLKRKRAGQGLKYYGFKDYDGKMLDLSAFQIGQTEEEHVRLNREHCFVYSLRQAQKDHPFISNEQIEHIKRQIKVLKLTSFEIKNLDTDLQIKIVDTNTSNHHSYTTKCFDPKDKDHQITIHLLEEHYIYNTKVKCRDPNNIRRYRSHPVNGSTLLQELIKEKKYTGTIDYEMQVLENDTQDDDADGQFNFEEQRDYKKPEGYKEDVVLVEDIKELLTKFVKEGKAGNLSILKDNRGKLLSFKYCKGKTVKLYRSFEAYGVSNQEEFDQLKEVYPRIDFYPTISSFAESLINFQGVCEISGALQDFCLEACQADGQKAVMTHTSGEFKDVSVLDINSLYPAAFQFVYKGKAQPYQGGKYGIIKTSQGKYLFDEEAQEYYQKDKNVIGHRQKAPPVGIQFEDKIYMSPQIEKLYKTKQRAKERGNQKLYKAVKLVLNSIYGRLRYQKGTKHAPIIVDDECTYLQRIEETNYNPEWMIQINGQFISQREQEIQHATYSQAHNAALLLHTANKILEQRIKELEADYKPLYINTDGIIISGKINKKNIGKELGQFKLEHEHVNTIIIGHNNYVIYNDDHEVLEKKASGFDPDKITLQDYKNLIRNNKTTTCISTRTKETSKLVYEKKQIKQEFGKNYLQQQINLENRALAQRIKIKEERSLSVSEEKKVQLFDYDYDNDNDYDDDDSDDDTEYLTNLEMRIRQEQEESDSDDISTIIEEEEPQPLLMTDIMAEPPADLNAPEVDGWYYHFDINDDGDYQYLDHEELHIINYVKRHPQMFEKGAPKYLLVRQRN